MRLSLPLALLALCLSPLTSRADASDTIERVKRSVVGVGTFQDLRTPQLAFPGTGFVVGDGLLIATNAHVLPAVLDSARKEIPVIAQPSLSGSSEVSARPARAVATDREYDLALLRIEGPPLPALALAPDVPVREGTSLPFTGFPIGPVLGLIPATHRAMVSALTPIALPARTTSELSARALTRLAHGPYNVLQLDGTAYLGNSGRPLYAIDNGALVGIINMVFVKGTRESALTQPRGTSYAMPPKPLAELIKQAIR